MSQMSKAAIAPRQPAISAADRAHPLFPLYRQHLSSCSALLIEASTFADWFTQHLAHVVSRGKRS